MNLRPIFACTVPLLCMLAVSAAEDPATLTARLSAAIDASPLAKDEVKAFAKSKLLPLISHPVLVAEVKAQNAKAVPLTEIQRIDKEWTGAEQELPIQKEQLGNKTAEAIRGITKELTALREVFAMDNQGANVGLNNLTSDYWQGDEDKWKKSFADGAGGVDMGKAKQDKSVGAVLQQVSLPLIDSDGTVVGAITFGIAIDQL